jgi:hypothetical protein
VAVLISIITSYYFAYHISDSDAASELVLGHLLAEQNRIISVDWFYSTEVRFFNANLVYMPLFKIFNDWHIVRFAATIILTALLISGYYFLCRQLKISKAAFLLSAAIMILPVNVVYGRIVLYHSYYMPSYIFGFWIVGLYLSCLSKQKNQRVLSLRVVLLLVISLISCLNGMRQFAATMIPLLITAVVIALHDKKSMSSTLSDMNRSRRTAIYLAVAVIIAGIVGIWLYNSILTSRYSARNMDYTSVSFLTVENLRNLWIGYLSLFGFQENRTLFSLEGILALGSAAAAIVMIFISIPYIVPKRKLENQNRNFMCSAFPLAMLGLTIMFLFISGNENYPQYYLTTFLWIFPFLGIMLDQMSFSAKEWKIKQVGIAMICVILFANGIFNACYYIRPQDKQVDYGTKIPINTLAYLQDVVDYLDQNHLDVGYATFWQANVITEATNGRIPMICIAYNQDDNSIYYYNWLTNKNYQDKTFVENKSVFLLVKFSERGSFEQTELYQYATLAYEQAYCSVYTFSDSERVWRYIQTHLF